MVRPTARVIAKPASMKEPKVTFPGRSRSRVRPANPATSYLRPNSLVKPSDIRAGGDRTAADTDTDPNAKPKPSKAAIKRVRHNVKKAGKTLTKEQIIKRAAAAIARDKKGGSARFDFAGDGAFTEDKDFGTKKNNELRAKMGKKRANVKGADRYGTGRKLKKNNGGGDDDDDSNPNSDNDGSGDPFPNDQQDGDPNAETRPAVDLTSGRMVKPRETPEERRRRLRRNRNGSR